MRPFIISVLISAMALWLFSPEASAVQLKKVELRPQGTFDICRVDSKSQLTTCQHWRGPTSSTRKRSIKTYDGWMALPCRQLKRVLPQVECKKSLGEVRFGEPTE